MEAMALERLENKSAAKKNLFKIIAEDAKNREKKLAAQKSFPAVIFKLLVEDKKKFKIFAEDAKNRENKLAAQKSSREKKSAAQKSFPNVICKLLVEDKKKFKIFAEDAKNFKIFAEDAKNRENKLAAQKSSKMSEARENESGANKISAFAEQTEDTFPDYSSKFKKSTFALCCQFLPCAGGSDLEDSPHKQQTVHGIYQHTLRTVSHCPSVSEYIRRASDKCAEVCTNNIQHDSCSYHCMRDSYKTSLVEFCAKPKLLFGYCPEYDPIGQTIQKDIYTPCNASDPSQILYRSSDYFFCDPGSCLQLREAGVRTGLTSLMTDATPVSGDINDTWLLQYWYTLLLLGLALILCIVLGCIFCQRRRLIVFRQWTKKGNPDDEQNENERAVWK